MIKVSHVKKKFIRSEKNKEKKEFYAVDDISFTALEGKVIGILGPNGAGKTTLLRSLAGIMQPTSGEITIDDLTFKKNETDIKRKIACSQVLQLISFKMVFYPFYIKGFIMSRNSYFYIVQSNTMLYNSYIR